MRRDIRSADVPLMPMNYPPISTTLKALVLSVNAILVAGCGGILHSSPEALSLPHRSPTPAAVDAPAIAFCELINNPARYRGIPVRTRATIITFREHQSIYDPSCYREDALTWIDFYSNDIYLKMDDTLRAFRGPGMTTRVSVTAVGRFEGPSNEGFGHLNEFKYRFVIMGLEGAEAVPGDVAWPWDVKESVSSR